MELEEEAAADEKIPKSRKKESMDLFTAAAAAGSHTQSSRSDETRGLIYGRESEKEDLINLLLNEEQQQEITSKFRQPKDMGNKSVVLVSGPPGIGKTTLAQAVYDDERVRHHFHLMGWLPAPPKSIDFAWMATAILKCTVAKGTASPAPVSAKEVLFRALRKRTWGRFAAETFDTAEEAAMCYDVAARKFPSSYPISGPDGGNKRDGEFMKNLIHKFSGKRFLLVADDALIPPTESLIILFRVLECSAVAKAKIITTRRNKTRSPVKILQLFEGDSVLNVYDLGGLPDYECWSLFQEHAFSARDFAGCEKLEHIGKEIVERCDGVPLAAKMIGSLLRGCEKDENIWMDVLHNMQEGSDVTGKDALKRAVRVSYTFMPSHLKACIAYCSVFHRDYKFTKDEVVKLWVEADLIQSSGSKTLEDTGAEYFDDLQRRLYFRRDTSFEDEVIDTFSMLDLVHDLSEKIEIAMDLPHMISDETIVYGRENDKRKVIELLLSDDRRKHDVSVIRLVGSAGVGKTTLVNLVYNDPTVCKIFETRLWISVNENSDLKGLTKAIIESLTGIFCGLSDLTEIQEALREELMGMRFLLVLDNVYNDYDLSFWNSLLGSLSAGGRGSIVITTTRDKILSDDMDMMHSYKLNRLSERNCWFVFRQHAFNLRDHNVHPDLVEIGKQLADRVEGLPLAAKTLGGILYSEQSKIFWYEIFGSELWYTDFPASGSISDHRRMLQDDQLGVDKILPALRLSYACLTFNVQQCFNYFSLFPKGYIFDKDHLFRLWMSMMSSQVMNVKHKPLKKGEVFIKHKEGKLEQDIGNQYFYELLKRSFFQHSPTCDPTVEKYVMHDQFHDLAQSESGSEFFRAETSKLSIVPEGVRHISLVPSEIGTMLQFEGFKDPTYIHTLLLINRSNIKWGPSVLCVENPAILNDLFTTLTCLRILDLSFTNIEEVPESIANLKQLRYLALNMTNIRKLPESVCSLYELQTLELQGCNYLSGLPASIGNLYKLQHLVVWKEFGYVFMPSGIGQLSELGTLSTFTVGRDERQCGIRELKELMNLRGSLCIGGLKNVVRGEEAMEAKLEMKQFLQTLTLQWFNSGEDLEDDQSEETAFEVLQNLKPHSNIEQLTLCDYSGNQFPNWMVDPSFSKLTSITLDNCYECNTLPSLGQLPSLKHLSIRMMDGVQQVGPQFCGSGTSRSFPSLETLKLCEMYELEEWCGVDGEDFHCLCSLSISRCDKLRKLPSFTYLQELSIYYCAELPDLPTLPCLKSLKIEGLQNLESLPQQVDLPALKILEISNCNKLLSLKGLSCIASLEQLKITRCPKLNCSPNEQLPSMLQVVDLRCGCSLLGNWCPDGFEEIIYVHQIRRKLVRQNLQGNKIWYESQKRCDWDRFVQHLNTQEPPLIPDQCSSEHIIEFLKKYSDQQIGETKLDTLIGRLCEAYKENNSRLAAEESNPFEKQEVKMYLLQVREKRNQKGIYPLNLNYETLQEQQKHHHQQQQQQQQQPPFQREWNKFIVYLRKQSPLLTPYNCSSKHVLDFLKYLGKFGKSKFHVPGCPVSGHLNSMPLQPCRCTVRQNGNFLHGLISRLHSAYKNNGGRPDSSPFRTREVRTYIQQVKTLQSRSVGMKKREKNKKRKRHPSPATATGSSIAAWPSIWEELTDIITYEEVLSITKELFENNAGSITTTTAPLFSEGSFDLCSKAVYGRDDDRKRVIELVLSNDHYTDCNVSVIHIGGDCGVGKTTLVGLVYNELNENEIFEARGWVSVNERHDIIGLTKEIVQSLAGVPCRLTELTEVQEAVREELMGKRFLLVLDNICNGDLSFWSSLLVPLTVGTKGSVIVATTRDESFSMDLMRSYELKRLSERNCWLMFQEHAFDGQDHNVHPDLIKVGEQIIGKCEGFPLTVKVLGNLLRSELNKTWWNAIQESDLWGACDRFPALRLSYNYLPLRMQQCFEYCSLFPKGYIFEKDHLVRLWMSAGFIEHEEGKHEQDSGSEYFDELLKRTFFQNSPICDPIGKKYVMHDLFHDLAQLVAVNKCLRVEACKLSCIPGALCHVSLAPSRFDTALQLEPLKEPRDIHTLLLINSSIMKWEESGFHVEDPAILNNLFSHLGCLRTLDLSFTDIEVVPETIADLEQLRYLALNKTGIRSLPESICRLKNLQSLELRGCIYLSELPTNIKNLTNLQHLDVCKESGFVFLPSGIGRLSGLRTLSAFTVGRDKNLCGISELKDLINLRGSLCIGGLGSVVRGEEAKEAKLEMKEHLQTLTLQWFNCVEDFEGDQSEKTAFEVLQNLKPHNNLEELTLRDYSGDQFPNWMVDPLFSKLSSITLDNCYECNILPRLGQLPSLSHLSIRMMEGVQRVERQFCGSGTSRGFPSLETLKLWEMHELEEWCGVEGEDFPCLRSLSISRCDKLRKLPTFTYLQELSIHYCSKLCDLPTLPCLKALKIEGLQNLESLPQQLDLPALKILEISNCNHLLSLEGLCQIASLEKLKITRCPKLNFSPNEQLPSILQVVDLHGGCFLLSNWRPDDFEEIINVHQVRRKLVRQKPQDTGIW